MIYYFAYGHNTNIETFNRRVPENTLLGPCVLQNWKFQIQEFGNIIPQVGAKVKGVLWEIEDTEIEQLDRDEDYGQHYTRR